MRGFPAKRSWATAMLIAVVAVALPAAAHAAYPGKNGKLAIEGDTRAGIWTVKPNGNDLSRVTGKKGLPFNPSWSPNGKWIAFTQSEDLWKMRADGSNKQKLVKGVSSDLDTNISWSPNGRKLVFNKNDDLWTVHSNGKKPKRITNTADGETGPSWSPKGDRIAFGFRDDVTGNRELHLIDPNGANETAVPNTKNGTEPDWSPNGKRVVYDSLGTGLLIIKPNGSGQTVFAKN